MNVNNSTDNIRKQSEDKEASKIIEQSENLSDFSVEKCCDKAKIEAGPESHLERDKNDQIRTGQFLSFFYFLQLI